MIQKDHDSWQISEAEFPQGGSFAEQMKFLLRYAILAPSSHNTQPWKFSIRENGVDIFADKDRWLKVADPDGRELHLSLGCALENFLIAAANFGFKYEISYFPGSETEGPVASVRFPERESISGNATRGLFMALTVRQTNHHVFEQRPVPESDKHKLQDCCGSDEGIFLYLTEDTDIRRKIEYLTVRADAIEFANPAFREELGFWVGEGVFGNSWLMAKIGKLALTFLDMGNSTAKKDSALLQSSPALGIVCSKSNDRISQVKSGQAFERIYLAAALSGLSIQPMSQVLQVPEIKLGVQALLPDSELFPQQPFRLGYAVPEASHTPRRALEELLVN